MTPVRTLRRPIVRWYGGKWHLAPWIASSFPTRDVYVEPFGGGASVLMRKPKSKLEVLNDLDSDVVGLYRTLADERASRQLALRCWLS
ncbi:DNA adenine methylase [Aureimonas psammosilenae]|uniref:DNA adenine methylase n=1 Tax=Aureimonas psammosilenae TaxID=2495496 RepID=UPI001260B6E1|nr:DNA adenine methylase [Aureimonas psammosilenae]